MSDKPDDKTRISPSRQKSASPAERLSEAKRAVASKGKGQASRSASVSSAGQDRIAGPSANPNSATAAKDRTRIAPGRQAQTSAAQSKTRVAPKSKKAPTAAADCTRIQPQKKQAAVSQDKTRLQPTKKQAPRSAAAAEPNSAQASDPRNQTQFQPAARRKDVTRIAAQPNEARSAPQQEDVAVNSGGQRVLKNRFVLEKVLGAGGMGVVYKARDLLKVEAQDRDPYVAIKVLGEEFKTHPEAFISLQRESRKSQSIAHPNIVNVHDFDRDGDTVFMTMEFLDGDPLDELILRYQSTGLPSDEAWEVIRGMISALVHAHAERIVHSDFKPGNVFVTRKGQAKVFDFGIARAVAQVEHHEDTEQRDLTVFDAGNLGALTPAYASLEMLQGAEPDLRDDVYALGCVAYEMLCGRHPYNKVPADEALRQGMKAERISHIKKHQWRAIERAIALKGEDRLASVTEFEDLLFPTMRSSSWVWPVALLLIVLAGGGYFYWFQQQAPKGPEFSEFDIRNELELKVRVDFHKENISKLLENPNFTDIWQTSLKKEVSDLDKITGGSDAWVAERKTAIYALYLERIEGALSDKHFDQAEKLISYAEFYNAEGQELAGFSEKIAELRAQQQQQREEQARLQQQRKQAEAARQAQRQQQAKKVAQQAQQQKQKSKQINDQFNVAMGNAQTQLDCQGGINMRNLSAAVNKLRELDAARYKKAEPDLIKSLAACIRFIGDENPARAQAALHQGKRLFANSSLLAAITIKSRDPCDASLAGLGARGKRAVCSDKLGDSGSTGPQMVVIPATGQLQAFAIGKYETTVAEYNRYCSATGKCKSLSQNSELPLTGVSVETARAYASWLSKSSGKQYRLPKKAEWLHAAKSRKRALDPNRNCELSTRGFQKGGNLVRYKVGKQNPWGLVNYVGNAQEWVYQSGRKLVAMGGSYRNSMDNCTITTSAAHDGSADDATGFRLVREIDG